MTKKKKLGIMAAVSAALLLGGALLYFKDDIAQNISENDLKPFKPIMISQGKLDDITDELMGETAAAEIIPIGSTQTIETAEIPQNIAVSDTLPDDVRQSLIDSAQSLNNAYPDAIGWLYIPDTSISYPVMQSDDNDYYLSHAYDGSYLKAGSVFLDNRCENRFMNPINIVYAHNMKNGSMFAGVLKFPDPAYLDSHKYGWLATPETVYRVDFFSCAKADWHDELYDGSLSVADWIPHVENLSVVSREMEYYENDRFISLSTCSYEFQNARTILTGKLVETIGG
ncbi:MAG: class B sortase [Ruminococcus sp.]|nr:class B sortase [Ruminococcus sp.]